MAVKIRVSLKNKKTRKKERKNELYIYLSKTIQDDAMY